MTRMLTTALATAAVMAAGLPIGAAAQGAERWEFAASINGWLASIDGQATFPPSQGGSHVAVDIKDILDNLHFVFMTSVEARKGPWGVFGDLVYMDIGAGRTDTRSFAIGGRPIPADVSADTHLDMRGTIVTVAGTYRMLAAPDSQLDVLGGVRMLDVRNRLKWDLRGNVGPIALPDRSGEVSQEFRNVDAVVGVKGRQYFGAERKWFAPYYLDIGTGDSDFTFQAMAGVGYTFKWGETLAAWRYMGTNFKSGEAFEDLNFNGPMVSLVMRF